LLNRPIKFFHSSVECRPIRALVRNSRGDDFVATNGLADRSGLPLMEIPVMAELVSLACFTLENRCSPSSDEAHRRVRMRTVMR
jgi:hypothetical protein